MAANTVVDDRIEREREFHDERFADDGTEARDRFYDYVGGARQALRAATDRFGPGDRVLELGAGLSSTGWELAARGVHVVAVDISGVAVDRCRRAAAEAGLETIDFREMNAEALDFGADSFDGVVGSGILHHLDLDRSLAEVHRVLAPGGKAVFYEPLGHNPLINLYRRVTPSMRTVDEHPLRRRDVVAAGRRFGRVETSVHHCAVIACALLPSRWGRRLQPVLDRLDGALLALPGVRWWGWITVMELTDPR